LWLKQAKRNMGRRSTTPQGVQMPASRHAASHHSSRGATAPVLLLLGVTGCLGGPLLRNFASPLRAAVTRGTPLARQASLRGDGHRVHADEVQETTRRGLALSGALVAAFPGHPAAIAEEVVEDAGAPKMQRLLISLGDNEALDKELKFWLDACKMAILTESKDADGSRTAVVGFGSKSLFGIELKVDPAVKKRKSPRLLNYNVMQPFVDPLNFLQISSTDKVYQIFSNVEKSGGASLIGSAGFIDVESPRGVPVRIVPRSINPSFELVSFNIEVPAFEPTVKFYQRSFGMQEVSYSPEEPPVQKLSVFLNSPAGGPKLLLSPVPDGRLKDRKLDEFEGVLMVASDATSVSNSATAAVQKAVLEQAAKDKEEERMDAIAKQQGVTRKKADNPTKAKPAVEVLDKTTRIDDGLGNILFVTSKTNFEASA